MLPYTAGVYFALLERFNAALWPLPLAAVLLALAALTLTLYRVRGGDRLIGALLAAGWAAGAVFHLRYFATLHFLAPVYGGLFVLQAVLLAWQGPLRNRLAFRFRPTPAGRAGLALALAALAAYPLLDGLGRADWLGLRLAGLAPSPTVLFTLGLLLLAAPVPRSLLVIPVLWALAAGYTAWWLAIPADLALPLLAVIAAVLAGWRKAPAPG
jgi:hypothetical protein